MHITVLSRSATIYTTKRLVEAARERGHTVRVLNPVQIEMGLGNPRPFLQHKGKRVSRTNVVIPRIAMSVNQYGLAVVNQLQLMGIPVLNSAQAIATSRNKMRCMQLLSANGIGIPQTVMATNPAGLKDMVSLVGGVPVLVKLLSASDRTGVMICETLESLEAALEAILGLGKNIIIQQYARGARHRDLRVLVVGGKMIAAMRRVPKTGRFARTLTRGAHFEKAAISASCAQAAISTARLVGLEVCAVDMLDLKGGPRVFEVNSSPGIRELEAVCEVDVAAAIIERATTLARRVRSSGAASALSRRAEPV